MKNPTRSAFPSFLFLSLFAFAGAAGCDPDLDGPGFGLGPLTPIDGGAATPGSGGVSGSGGRSGTPPAGSANSAALTGAWTAEVDGVTEGLEFRPPDQVVSVRYQGTPADYSRVEITPGTFRTQGAMLFFTFGMTTSCTTSGGEPEEEAFDFRVAGNTLHISSADFEATLTRAASLPVDSSREGCIH